MAGIPIKRALVARAAKIAATVIAATIAATCVYALSQTQGSGPANGAPDEVFAHVRDKVQSDLQRLPNYTCVQTIIRTTSRSTGRQGRTCEQILHDRQLGAAPVEPFSWERLRLEVAIAGSGEVYAWVGESKFGDLNLHDLVGGHTATGDFGAFLSSIFSGDPVLSRLGERLLDGRQLLEYAYQIPLAQSKYHIKVGAAEYLAAYSGLILVDPTTERPVRLTADSAQLPPKTGYCIAENRIDYQTVRIGSEEELLPATTRRNAIDTDGDELLNVTAYTGCHEYVGKSSVSFDDPPVADSDKDKLIGFGLQGDGAAPPRPSFDAGGVPAGVHFSARIVTPIDSDQSATGDPVEAVLREPMYDKRGRTIAKAGAHIHGRLRRFMKISTGRNAGYDVGVEFLSIDLPGSANVPLRARLNVAVGPQPLSGGQFHFKEAKLMLKQLDAQWLTMAPAN